MQFIFHAAYEERHIKVSTDEFQQYYSQKSFDELASSFHGWSYDDIIKLICARGFEKAVYQGWRSQTDDRFKKLDAFKNPDLTHRKLNQPRNISP